MTLISRTAPLLDCASVAAVASAGLAKSKSARSIGTKILWYMAGSSQNARISHARYCDTLRGRASGQLRAGKRFLPLGVVAAAAQQIAHDVRQRRFRQGGERERAGNVHRGEPQPRGQKPIEHALAE